ncbi:MAG: response regulator [Actinomycetota bacterium]|nr:response regulator [Actinomycetota bacterium]
MIYGADEGDRVVSLIDVLPTLLWVGFAFFVVVYLGRDLTRSLGSRLTKLQAAGVAAEFAGVEEALDSATDASLTAISSSQRRGAEARARRNLDITRGIRILWVDDQPTNNVQEKRLLESMGMAVDQVVTSNEGIEALRKAAYDLVISDIDRPEDGGLGFLEKLRELALPFAVIFYITNYQREKGLPTGAFGITNRVDELLHLVLDVVERRRLA